MRPPGKTKNENLEICILAGGLSQRMGHDKSRLRLGTKTMLGIIKDVARSAGGSVRIIRNDLVPRCGPLGGILTALKTSPAKQILFLACDMPFITVELLRRLAKARTEGRAMFVRKDDRVGFPFLLPVTALNIVQLQIEAGDLSLQSLARVLKGKKVALPRSWSTQLQNINTPEKFELAKRTWAARKLNQ
jgi:molybdopterin-guanine dinucleotide biosynthesis protein A